MFVIDNIRSQKKSVFFDLLAKNRLHRGKLIISVPKEYSTSSVFKIFDWCSIFIKK